MHDGAYGGAIGKEKICDVNMLVEKAVCYTDAVLIQKTEIGNGLIEGVDHLFTIYFFVNGFFLSVDWQLPVV